MRWEIFENFEELYKLLSLSEREYTAQNIVHTKSFVYARIPKYKPQRKEERVIYETPKCESWKEEERMIYKILELELRREIRIINRNSEL